MAKKFVVINQARMTSSRLPGKVLKTVLGKSLLEYQIERIRRSKLIDELVIATTTNTEDQPIVELCEKLGVPCFRGSELDVLGRYYGASLQVPSEGIVRVTSDCPLIDPAGIDLTIEQFASSGCDYMSNSEAFPIGMNAEVFSSQMLTEAHHKGVLPYEREHVTPYFYTRPQQFQLGQVQVSNQFHKYRLTVDTPEDFQLVKILLERLMPTKPAFTLADICHEFEKDPGLQDINRNIRQKTYTE